MCAACPLGLLRQITVNVRRKQVHVAAPLKCAALKLTPNAMPGDRKPTPKQCASCTGWCLRETSPYHKESLGKVCSSKASFCTRMSAEMEISFNHILGNERMFENLIFLATLNWASTISTHKLQKKRQNFHNQAAVAATAQIEKPKPEWLLSLVSGRL